MHELALMEGMVAAVTERVSPARVTTVRLRVGALAAVVPDCLRFCFEVCTRETLLEGAILEVLPVQGRARCRRCGVEQAIDSLLALCVCGSADLEVQAGLELLVTEVEVQ